MKGKMLPVKTELSKHGVCTSDFLSVAHFRGQTEQSSKNQRFSHCQNREENIVLGDEANPAAIRDSSRKSITLLETWGNSDLNLTL